MAFKGAQASEIYSLKLFNIKVNPSLPPYLFLVKNRWSVWKHFGKRNLSIQIHDKLRKTHRFGLWHVIHLEESNFNKHLNSSVLRQDSCKTASNPYGIIWEDLRMLPSLDIPTAWIDSVWNLTIKGSVLIRYHLSADVMNHWNITLFVRYSQQIINLNLFMPIDLIICL